MGLDLSFYRYDETGMLDLRNHLGPVNRLLDEPHVTIEPCRSTLCR